MPIQGGDPAAAEDAARGARAALPARRAGQGNQGLLEVWRRLGTSDHCYCMCTKWFADGDLHRYFNPHKSPYDAFVAFMNVLTDLERRCDACPVRVEVPAAEMAVIV
jgi:alpha-amylase/alpha-mannosidase (GH57 family)